MYLLKFDERNELCQMYVSKSIPVLKLKAQEEIDGKITFREDKYGLIWIYCKGIDIGLIGEIQEI